MDWVGYFCEVNGEAAVNAVDLDVAAPQAERPFIVYLRARRSLWLPCDLEPEEEAQMLEDIEGYVERIAALHDALYVGRSTMPDGRCFVLYAPEDKYLRRWLERTFSTLGTYGYDPDIASGRDAAWTVYRKFLLPGPHELAAIEARAKRA